MNKLLIIPIWYRKVLIVTPPTDILKSAIKHKIGRSIIKQVKNDPPLKNFAACVYYDDDNGRYLLWLEKCCSNDTIVHETNHIVNHMMKFLGARNEHEASAYTQEYLFRLIRKTIRR